MKEDNTKRTIEDAARDLVKSDYYINLEELQESLLQEGYECPSLSQTRVLLTNARIRVDTE